MKKILLTIIAFILLIPSVNALDINPLGLSIELPEGYNIVTRNNNDKKYLSYMYQNNIYLQTEDNMNQKIFIRAIENPGIQDFKVGSDILRDVIGLAQNVNTNDYEFVESDPYKWVKFKYKDEKTDKQVIEYYLSWKKIFLTITIQAKNQKYDDNLETLTDKMVKGAKLTGEGEVEVNPIYNDGIDFFDTSNKIIPVVIVCLILIIFTYWITRRRKK